MFRLGAGHGRLGRGVARPAPPTRRRARRQALAAMRTGRPPQAEAEPRTFASEITAAIARVIDEAAARGDTAEPQAERVLDGLDRRGLLRGAPEAGTLLQHNRGDPHAWHAIVERSDSQYIVAVYFQRSDVRKNCGRIRKDGSNSLAILWVLIRNLIPVVLLLVCLALHRVGASRHLCSSGHRMSLKKSPWKWRWDVEGLVSARTWGFKSPLRHKPLTSYFGRRQVGSGRRAATLPAFGIRFRITRAARRDRARRP